MTVLDDRDLWSLVAQRALLSPDRVLVVDEHGREVTFAEFRFLAERVAAGLYAGGVRQGTRVMWMLPTWIESLVLSAALSRLGAIQVPLIPVYRQREIGFIARQTSAPLMFVPGVWRGTDYVDLATSATATMDKPPTLVTVDRSLPDGDPVTLPLPPAPPSRSDLRWIFYTSGTTSDPKGAKHSDATIAAVVVGDDRTVALDRRRRDDVDLPLRPHRWRVAVDHRAHGRQPTRHRRSVRPLGRRRRASRVTA